MKTKIFMYTIAVSLILSVFGCDNPSQKLEQTTTITDDPSKKLEQTIPITDDYKVNVKSFAESRLYKGKTETEVYADVTKAEMHYLYVAFLEMYPKSQHEQNVKKALKNFRLLEVPPDKPMVINFETLKGKYGFNGKKEIYYWGNGAGLIEVDSAGKRIWKGPICFGNLQLLAGSFTGVGEELEFLPGTKLIYPISTQSK
ncbi:MAG: hypothetical protein V2B20_28495 [Pseudomonadota bacterium]